MEENENKIATGDENAIDTDIESTSTDVPESVSNEAAALEETEVISEEAVEAETEAVSGEDAGDSDTAGIDDAEDGSEDTEDVSAPDAAAAPSSESNPASKKANIFYIVTIILLVGAVIALVIILVTSSKDKEDEPDAEPTPTITATEDEPIRDSEGNEVTVAPEATEAPEEAPKATWSDDTDYGVTIELGEYRGLKGVIEYDSVTDEDVEAELESFASYHTTTEEITSRTDVQMGDIANIDFLGTLDGEPFDGGEGEGYDLEIGSGSFIPGFEEAIVGHNKGENFDIDLTFPEDYHSADLAGKAVVFNVTVNSISENVIPEINDTLIAENTEYTTVEDYKNYIRESLLEDRKETATENARSTAIKAFVDSCTFGGGIDQEVADYTAYNMDLTDQQAQYAYGMDAATLYSYLMGWTKEEYEENMRERCEFSIKYQNALDEIIKKENLTLSTEEYDDFFNSTFIDSYGYESKEEVLNDYTEEELDNIVNTNALRTKAENIILDSLVLEEKVN